MFHLPSFLTACILSAAGLLGSSVLASERAAHAPSYVAPIDPTLASVQASGRKAMAAAGSVPLVDLGAWIQQRHAPAAPISGAAQIGAPRASASTGSTQALHSHLNWQPSGAGGLVAALRFRSHDAYALRLGVLVERLPGDAIVRIYSPDQPEDQFVIAGQRIVQLLDANQQAGDHSDQARTWWSPESGGDTVTLEIELPPHTPATAVRIAVPSVLHVYANIYLPLESEPLLADAQAGSGSCNVDASCQTPATLGADGQQLANAVARMSYVKDGAGYVCTGTLINDRASSGTPYFLTANHCIGSQTVASTLQTHWFYRASSCNANTLSSASRTLRNGATLLYTTGEPDTTLLRLNDAPPAGALFAGWEAAKPSAGQALVGIHHPHGDLLKVSQGVLQGHYNCSPFDSNGQTTCYGSTSQNGKYINIRWDSGTTEPGSSGSGIFSHGRLMGVLSAGSASCSNFGGSSIYASLSDVYPALQQWLGADTAKPALARQAVYRFYNEAAGTHFYTISAQERDSIIQNLPGFRFEGVGFYAAAQPGPGLTAVHRFFNTLSGSHFYTIDAQERESVQKRLPSFLYEGQSWYANTDSSSSDMRPIYRFYNETTHTHFYTATDAERDYVIHALPSFHFEGTAYYVWTTP